MEAAFRYAETLCSAPSAQLAFELTLLLLLVWTLRKGPVCAVSTRFALVTASASSSSAPSSGGAAVSAIPAAPALGLVENDDHVQHSPQSAKQRHHRHQQQQRQERSPPRTPSPTGRRRRSHYADGVTAGETGLAAASVTNRQRQRPLTLLKQEEIRARERAKRLAEFEPEPLCDTVLPTDHYALRPRVVTGRVGKYVTLVSPAKAENSVVVTYGIGPNSDGRRRLLNLVTHNYLGLADRPDSAERAVRGLRTYGVGSCGPRGFYGTADVHLELEARLASFVGVEQACLYSYGFATISSAIPAYSKPGDVIFADEQVNFAIQQGITASRSDVYYFRHNDPDDLERLLRAQDERDASDKRSAKVRRRFLLLEGIYANTGTVVRLADMVRLRARYRCRLFIDESVSFGVLGRHGRGVREHFDVPAHEIDLMSGSLEHAISSYGGFLAGSHFLMEHQRLGGLGYCFSASLPPLQAVVSLGHLDLIEQHPEWLEQLAFNCRLLDGLIANRLTALRTDSDPLSPVKHLRLTSRQQPDASNSALDLKIQNDVEKLTAIVAYAEEHGLALQITRLLEDREILRRPASIRLVVSNLLTEKEIYNIVDILRVACEKLL